MFGLWKTSEKPEPESLRQRVNQLEIDIEALKLASAERTLATLNAVEKVLHQLAARERKRAEENPSQEPSETTIPFRGDIQVPPKRRANY